MRVGIVLLFNCLQSEKQISYFGIIRYLPNYFSGIPNYFSGIPNYFSGIPNHFFKQEGNADPALKPDFYIFLLIFQHKCIFLVLCKLYHLKVTMWHISVKVSTKATLCVSMK